MLLISACSTTRNSGRYFEDDGPDKHPPDVSRVPDAEPRVEPLAKSGNKPYAVYGVNYTPLLDARGYQERGIASWYGKKFHGRRTSSGEPYDMYAMTAAHRTLPLPSYVRVTNLQNGRQAIVRVNDRGPFLHNRLIDLSYAAAHRLGVIGTGTAMVEVQSITPGEPAPAVVPVATDAGNSAGQPARLTVQVGAFSIYQNAEGLRNRLARAGFGPLHIVNATDTGTTIYRVRIGPIASVEQGDRLVEDVARYGIRDALLVVD